MSLKDSIQYRFSIIKMQLSLFSFNVRDFDQVWCLIILIPDLCPLSYFGSKYKEVTIIYLSSYQTYLTFVFYKKRIQQNMLKQSGLQLAHIISISVVETVVVVVFA